MISVREVLTLPADRRVLRQVSHLIDRFSRVVKFSAIETHDVQVAVAEACTNAIIHGLEENSERTFSLEVELQDRTLVITLKEEGKPFDFDAIPAADLSSSLKERRIGGLGVHLIFNLMESVEYRTEPDGSKVLRMTKTAAPGD